MGGLGREFALLFLKMLANHPTLALFSFSHKVNSRWIVLGGRIVLSLAQGLQTLARCGNQSCVLKNDVHW
jgi:hypothetical protein